MIMMASPFVMNGLNWGHYSLHAVQTMSEFSVVEALRIDGHWRVINAPVINIVRTDYFFLHSIMILTQHK